MENLNLKPYYIEGRGIYVPIINKVLAVENSCEGRKVPFEVAVSKSVPTVREWLIILFFKGEINIILRELGKEPLRSGWYWSSSTDRNESGSAWNVNLEDGTVRCDRCAYEDFAREVYSL